MTELNSTTLVKRISGAIGVAVLVSVMGLPAVAQMTPRPGTSDQPGVTRPGATPTTPNPQSTWDYFRNVQPNRPGISSYGHSRQ